MCHIQNCMIGASSHNLYLRVRWSHTVQISILLTDSNYREVVEAGVTNFFGQTVETPITVVVAGGKGITKIPVVLGVIEHK